MENIAIIVPSLEGGGAERVASLLSQELSKKHNVYLITFDSEDMAYKYGGHLIDINVKSHSNFFIKIINVFRRAFLLKRVKKKYGIHISISLLDGANVVNILSKHNDKTIVSIHSNLSKRPKNFYQSVYKQIIKHFYKYADRTIACSAGVYMDLINNYALNKETTSYIYNPIDIGKINKLSQCQMLNESIIANNQFTIINIGRLTNAKGQWHLIRALSYVKKEIKNIKLVILGQGELEGYLKDLVKKLDLQNNVVFLGYQKNPFKFISKSDLFVLSSLYEGFGNVLIEAMACGVPIISTDCRSGPREILAPETDIKYETQDIEYCEYGLLVPVCDGKYYDSDTPLTYEEKILAISIIKLYESKQLRYEYSEKGKDRARDFDINNIIKEWEKLITDICNKV